MDSLEVTTKKNIDLWLNGNFPSEIKQEIKRLQVENPKELADAFYTSLSFGTGGLRGIMGIGTNRMNEWTVALATQGLANYISLNFTKSKVAIAYDVRHNSEFFASRVAEVLSANGIEVYLFSEPRPTPLLSFTIRKLNCQAGIVITASHNPKEYNGYKVYWNDGAQVTPPHDNLIIQEVNKLSIKDIARGSNPKLIYYLKEEMDNLYMDMVKSQILPPPYETLANYRSELKIIYTPLHGTGISLLPKLLKNFGFTDLHIPSEQASMDGDFPTVSSPNPEEPKAMQMGLELAKTKQAQVVFATDPDADRIGVGIEVNKGEYLLLNGNQIIAMLLDYALQLKQEQGLLCPKSYILKTIVTSELLDAIAKHYGVNCYTTLTGFKWIAEKIRQQNQLSKYVVGGGEESFGILLGNEVRDKDGVSAVILFAEMLARYKSQNIMPLAILENIYRKYGFYYEALYSMTKTGLAGVKHIQGIMDKYRQNPPKEILGVSVVESLDYERQLQMNWQTKESSKLSLPKSNVLQFILADRTKISLRPSGTEPKIKFYISIFEADYQKFTSYNAAVDSATRKIQAYVDELGFLR